MKETFSTIVRVLKQPAYALVAMGTAVAMIIISTYLLNLPLIWSMITADWTLPSKISLLVKLQGGFITNNTLPALVLLILISTLAGMNLALAIHRWKTQRALSMTQKSTCATGVSIGVLAAGCSSCGLSILAMIGLAGVIAFLPFQGLELSILSIIILITTLFWLSKNPVKCVSSEKKVEEIKRK